MAPEQRTDRDTALRALLVARVESPVSASTIRRDRVRIGIVSGVVLTLVIALSVVAIHLGNGTRALPADGGLPTPTAPPGVVLGRFSSADGAVQHHDIRPDGLALTTSLACEGGGEVFLHIPHAFDAGSGCSGISTSGSGDPDAPGQKGTPGTVTLSIRSTPGTRWTLIVSGIPETYVTPQPVVAPTDSTGAAVPFCTSTDLDARFDSRTMPEGVTEVAGGEVRFTNAGSSACALAGWPTVLFTSDGGSGVLGHHTITAIDARGSTERGLEPVILKPGGHAWTQVDWYLPNYYPANDQGRCESQTVYGLWIDLANSHASSEQSGVVQVGIPATTACRNGPWGTDGKYGQISATEFVGYSLKSEGR